MNSYENEICNAIQILIDKSLAKLKFNKTIACIIKAKDTTVEGKYQVSYQDSLFYAYAIDSTEIYAIGTPVEVLILNNDMSRKKFIIGREVAK